MPSSFGKRLYELRKQAGYSQEELVKIINRKYGTNINRTTISKWENGTQQAMMETAIMFANFFNVSLDSINGETSAKHEKSPTPLDAGDFVVDERVKLLTDIATNLPVDALVRLVEQARMLELWQNQQGVQDSP